MVTRRRTLRLAAALCGLGCGEPSPAPSTGSSGGFGSTVDPVVDSSGAVVDSSSSDAVTIPGPPVVIDIGQDVPVLREGESVVLTAVVFDPDDDVVQGELFGPGLPSSYGLFTAHPSDRWRVTVRWDDVHERSPLDFSQEQPLPLWARFVDAAGHEAIGAITLRAVCAGLQNVACDGQCVDLQVDDDNCDACGHTCVAGPSLRGVQQSGGCEGSTCQPWWSDCLRIDAQPIPQTCAQRCAAEGATCVDSGCSIGFSEVSVMTYQQLDTCVQAEGGWSSRLGCDGALAASSVVRCCCV